MSGRNDLLGRVAALACGIYMPICGIKVAAHKTGTCSRLQHACCGSDRRIQVFFQRDSDQAIELGIFEIRSTRLALANDGALRRAVSR